MAKVILIGGKVCCGKSTYAKHLRKENRAVLLSVDEIMLEVFGLYAGDRHDEYTQKIKKYLFAKSLEIIAGGSDVILDWGFWTRQERTRAKSFYQQRNIPCAFHYIDIDDKTWQERIILRNQKVQTGETQAYIIDCNLMEKFERCFEPPAADEIDVRVQF